MRHILQQIYAQPNFATNICPKKILKQIYAEKNVFNKYMPGKDFATNICRTKDLGPKQLMPGAV